MEAIGTQGSIAALAFEARRSGDRGTASPHPAPGTADAVERLRLGDASWREDGEQAQLDRLPRGSLARDVAVLVLAALLAGAGLRAWLGQGAAERAAAAQTARR